MNPIERRLQLDLAAARYLDALEREDFAVMAELWSAAGNDEELETVFRELHSAMIEERAQKDLAAVTEAIVSAVERHVPTAEIVREPRGPITVADVADELCRNFAAQVPIDAHLLNERLRDSREALPENLGVSPLTVWAEARFGAAPPEYWKVFRQAAVKLELRRAAETEYRLAARRSPNPEAGT